MRGFMLSFDQGVTVTSQVGYALGSSDLEHQRLMVQARFLRPWTERFLQAGGLAPGMSVLDLGSGFGDVTLLAASIVGPEGRVIGIDRDEVITVKARQRVANEALSDIVSFDIADLADYRPPGPVDAVVGRYVLLYQDDPAGIVGRFAQFLKPGGVVIFHETDLSDAVPSWPPSVAWDECMRLVNQAYLAAGAMPDLGRLLNHTFRAAGLPAPLIESATPIASTPYSPILDLTARSLSSLEPLFQRMGVMLPYRLNYEELMALWCAAIAEGSQLNGATQYGAWTRVP